MQVLANYGTIILQYVSVSVNTLYVLSLLNIECQLYLMLKKT